MCARYELLRPHEGEVNELAACGRSNEVETAPEEPHHATRSYEVFLEEDEEKMQKRFGRPNRFRKLVLFLCYFRGTQEAETRKVNKCPVSTRNEREDHP